MWTWSWAKQRVQKGHSKGLVADLQTNDNVIHALEFHLTTPSVWIDCGQGSAGLNNDVTMHEYSCTHAIFIHNMASCWPVLVKGSSLGLAWLELLWRSFVRSVVNSSFPFEVEKQWSARIEAVTSFPWIVVIRRSKEAKEDTPFVVSKSLLLFKRC